MCKIKGQSIAIEPSSLHDTQPSVGCYKTRIDIAVIEASDIAAVSNDQKVRDDEAARSANC